MSEKKMPLKKKNFQKQKLFLKKNLGKYLERKKPLKKSLRINPLEKTLQREMFSFLR